MGLLRRPGRRERRRLRERPRKEALRRRRGLVRELGQLLGQVWLEPSREAAAAAHRRRRVRRRVETPRPGRGRRRHALVERRDPVERRRPRQARRERGRAAAEEVAAGPAGARRPRRRLVPGRVERWKAPAERRDLAVEVRDGARRAGPVRVRDVLELVVVHAVNLGLERCQACLDGVERFLTGRQAVAQVGVEALAALGTRVADDRRQPPRRRLRRAAAVGGRLQAHGDLRKTARRRQSIGARREARRLVVDAARELIDPETARAPLDRLVAVLERERGARADAVGEAEGEIVHFQGNVLCQIYGRGARATGNAPPKLMTLRVRGRRMCESGGAALGKSAWKTREKLNYLVES
mmetsp:Transcript_16557/g.47142  ORF Transcript_16557/g.47142 Transcript_16557/m.47142 type:complete len:354 (-) Transcript_16557:1527-2588(-)